MTEYPQITSLPTPPNRGQDEELFAQLADAFMDALPQFRDELNAFAAQLVAATIERVVNEAAASYDGAIAARNAAIQARDAAAGYAASIDPASLVRRTGDQVIDGVKNFLDKIQVAGVDLGTIAFLAKATAAEFRAAAANRALAAAEVWASAVPIALVDAATIAVDLSTFINGKVTLAGNRTLGAPTNGKPGQSGCIEIKQDATGGRTLSYATAWSLGSTTPTLSTAANARDLLYFQVLSDGKVDAYLSKGR